MRIPYQALSDEALRGVIEEFVSREGTEYGVRDFSLQEKVEQVMAQLVRGEVVIDYEPDTGTCNLLTAGAAGSSEPDFLQEESEAP